MRYLGRFICLCGVLILSGCTINYNIIINDNFTVKEEIMLLEENSILNTVGNDINSSINKLVSLYVDDDNDTDDIVDFNVNKTLLIKKRFENDSGIYLQNSYNDLDSYNFSDYICTFFQRVVIVEKNSNYIMNMSNFIYSYLDNYLNNDLLNFKNDKIVFSIRVPYFVYESNADYVNEDVYVWEFTKNNYKNKEIKLNFSKNNIVYNNKVDTLVPDYVSNNLFVDEVVDAIGGSSFSWQWFLVIILFVLIIVIFIVKRKSDMKNKI